MIIRGACRNALQEPGVVSERRALAGSEVRRMAELITLQVSGAVAFGGACPVLRRQVCGGGVRWMQGGRWIAHDQRWTWRPKTRQRLDWRQGDQSRGRRDKNGADRRGSTAG